MGPALTSAYGFLPFWTRIGAMLWHASGISGQGIERPKPASLARQRYARLDQMSDPGAKRKMIGVAESYERVAKRAEISDALSSAIEEPDKNDPGAFS
jgi:hypothetical protein